MHRLLCPLLLLLGMVTFAQAAPALLPVYTPFVGQWTGTLEYRDYQSNKRVQLPTLLTVTPTPGGTSLVYAYVYNDGPGKTVIETETVTIDAKSQTYSILGSGDKKPSVYQVTGLVLFTKAHGGKLVLHGSGEDNDKPAEFRKTITVTPKTLTILKEVRPPGSTFQFRNQYTFTRLAKPVPTTAGTKNQAFSISVPPVSRTVPPPEYLLTPPVPLGSGPVWRTAQEDSLREATFRYLFAVFPPDSSPRPDVYYISAQGFPWGKGTEAGIDPDPAFLRRFRGSAPPVRAVSALLADDKNWRKSARHRWIIYCVSSFHWKTDTQVVIDAGRSLSGCFGSESLWLTCVLRNGWWEIVGTISASA